MRTRKSSSGDEQVQRLLPTLLRCLAISEHTNRMDSKGDRRYWFVQTEHLDKCFTPAKLFLPHCLPIVNLLVRAISPIRLEDVFKQNNPFFGSC